jgi:hypothetical protein
LSACFFIDDEQKRTKHIGELFPPDRTQFILSLSHIRQQSLGAYAFVYQQSDCFVEILFLYRVGLIIIHKIVSDNGIDSDAGV